MYPLRNIMPKRDQDQRTAGIFHKIMKNQNQSNISNIIMYN